MSTQSLKGLVNNDLEKSPWTTLIKPKTERNYEDNIKNCTGGICCLFVLIVVSSSYAKWAFGTI
jgi:hypothetical protein